ncbi:S8 family serine peptidase [Paenibacillus sediminis]
MIIPYICSFVGLLCPLVFFLVISSSKEPGITAQGFGIREYIGLNKSTYSTLKGRNVTVAIVDSGIESHNGIQKQRILAFKDFVNGQKDFYDDYGHGTFIAGLIGSSGEVTGIAPKSNFVILKVLDNKGKTDESTLLNALNWISNNKDKYNIKVVNLSIGVENRISAPSDEDPIFKILSKLKNQGILVVCSSGNSGPAEGSILYPAMSKDVLTVGSVNNNRSLTIKDDKITISSSRGLNTSHSLKPDLVTLGVDINSFDYKNPTGFTIGSGSSYSAAIVSGIATILFEKFTNADTVKQILRENVVSLNGERTIDQGKGELYFK